MDAGLPDEALMRRFQAGDQLAFETLVRRRREHAIRFCQQMLRDVESSEDMAQEAFSRILLQPHGWSGRSSFSTYLFAILKNLCLDELRWRSRWQNRAPQQSDPPDPSPTPEEALTRQLERERVTALLEQLSPDYRAALLLREYHGLSYAEIAEIMEWTEAKTKVTIYRARVALGRELMTEGGYERAT